VRAGDPPDPASGQDLDWQGLKTAAAQGVRWATIGRVGSEVVRFGSIIALARLLSPAEFGRAAIAMVVSAFALSLTIEGFGSPLVQRASVKHADLEAATFMSLTFGATVTLLVSGGGPVVFDPLFGARAAELCQLMGPIFLVTAISVVPRAQLQRRLDFRKLSVLDLASVLISSAVSVAMAASGSGASALVVGTLAGAAVAAGMAVVWGGMAWPRPHLAEMRALAQFGTSAALAGSLWTAFRNVDYTILAAKLSATQVGLYWRAYQIGVEYQTKLSALLVTVAFPIYSRTRDAELMHTLRGRLVRLYTALTIPSLALLVALAPMLIPSLYGSAWAPAVLPCQLLAVAGMVTAVGYTMAPLLLAAGYPRALLGWNLFQLILYAVAILIAASHGLITVCVTVVSVGAVQMVVGYYMMFCRILQLPFDLPKEIAPGVLAAVPSLAATYPLTQLAISNHVPAVVALPALAILGVTLSGVTLRTTHRHVWRDLGTIAKRLIPSRQKADAAPPEPSDKPAILVAS
jgi:O-antigen/teichoic acid export membrane protein